MRATDLPSDRPGARVNDLLLVCLLLVRICLDLPFAWCDRPRSALICFVVVAVCLMFILVVVICFDVP